MKQRYEKRWRREGGREGGILEKEKERKKAENEEIKLKKENRAVSEIEKKTI